MTIDLNLLHSMRDLQLALEVAERAELGWFDIEYIIYGCTYWENGRRYYRLSNDAEDIYGFIENGGYINIISSVLNSTIKRYPVPAGMREVVEKNVKIELGREMRKKYPEEFFKELENLSNAVVENTALDYLERQWEKVECTFDPESLTQFSDLIDYTYLHRKINYSTKEDFQRKIAEEFKSMEEVFEPQAVFVKKLFGTEYIVNGKQQFFINARKGNVYQKQMELESKGIYSSPIINKTYHYNRDTSALELREKFKDYLKKRIDESNFKELKTIFTQNNCISREGFLEEYNRTVARYGCDAAETLSHYGKRWGITWDC